MEYDASEVILKDVFFGNSPSPQGLAPSIPTNDVFSSDDVNEVYNKYVLADSADWESGELEILLQGSRLFGEVGAEVDIGHHQPAASEEPTPSPSPAPAKQRSSPRTPASKRARRVKCGLQRETIQCELCKKELKNKSASLKKHRLVHIDKRDWPHQCEWCGKRFSQRNNLTRHIGSIHKHAEFECDICRHVCSRPDKLKEHVRRKHGKGKDQGRASGPIEE